MLARIAALSAFLLLLATNAAPPQRQWNVTCPAQCKCTTIKSALYWLNTTDCSNQKLFRCPQDIPADTGALLLKGNAIQSFDAAKFPSLPKLLQLDLSHNKINSLTDAPLMNIASLQRLNLDGNNINALTRGSLKLLRDLTTLSLANNDLKTLVGDSLSGLSHLRHLTLSGNKLREINATWWQHTAYLETLQLDNNQITSIEDSTFASLHRLSDLSLANNDLKSLRKYSFSGLDKLQNLNLDGNRLETIPALAFGALPKLKVLSLNDNPIEIIGYRDLYKLPVYEIHLCHMPVLKIIDSGAFSDLPNLRILRMHDNSRLAYLARGAFILLPNLRELYLHGNKLLALSSDVRQVLPNLHSVSFYGNPIQCNSNIAWMLKLNFNASALENTELVFDEPCKMKCNTPIKQHGVSLCDVPSSAIALKCPPTVVPFFERSYNMELGATATFECRAIGTNQHRVSWILANGKPLNSTSNDSRIKFDPIGKLSIRHVKAIDAGTYTCVAAGDTDFDTASSILRVHSSNVHVLSQNVANDFVTVTWNGTGETIFSAGYTILHRLKGSGTPYKQIDIHTHGRSFTVAHLRPETTYEFCIAYGSNRTKLNCIDIRTMSDEFKHRGITTFDPTKTLVVFMSVCLSLVVTCFTVAMVKRYRRREAYKDPTTGNYNLGHMTNISLENLYYPPTTPISTSKTCLVSKRA